MSFIKLFENDLQGASVEDLEARLRHLRKIIWDYEGDRADEIADDMVATKAALLKARNAGPKPPVGPYSGLTRQELRQTGTSETDWY